jgi:hypothetical protein
LEKCPILNPGIEKNYQPAILGGQYEKGKKKGIMVKGIGEKKERRKKKRKWEVKREKGRKKVKINAK